MLYSFTSELHSTVAIPDATFHRIEFFCFVYVCFEDAVLTLITLICSISDRLLLSLPVRALISLTHS